MHRSGVEAEQGDLRHRQGPEQAPGHMQSRSPCEARAGPRGPPQAIDHGVERRPVQAELHEDRRHPDGVFRIGAGPDEDRQGHGEEADGVGQKLGLGVQRPRVDA